MSNGNTPTPEEMADLFNSMKEELQQLKKERAEWNKGKEGKHLKEPIIDDEDLFISTAQNQADQSISKEIMDFEMPLNFTLPTTLKPYKGIGDPVIHVTKFESMMILNVYKYDSDYLSTIKQGPQESLREYMERFQEAATEIPDLDAKVHLHALKSGLRTGRFQESLAIRKPRTLAEFRESSLPNRS
ncbi:hypothetical protein PIB30_007624 [Stylosanthes scabra]|uniref:Retrotransposon gag domain-containing protein n=1 Tax=Stylosanthes scabra TaxID=79078 RepID=A0ABU6V4X5_9FABA|nr:hypothetical protein [Stylosanthes scabra]